MKNHDDNRAPEEIESDIERTREEMSSTIDAIQNKLTPSQLMDQAFAYARTSLPADFGSNLNHAIRDNPVPVTLVGIGLAWLMMSSRNSDGRARMRRQMGSYDATYGTDYSSDAGEGRLHRAASKVGETGRNLKDTASETSRNLANKASDLSHRISDQASSMTDRAREMAQGASSRISSSSGNARARMSELTQRSQDQYYRAKDSFSQMVDEQPLVLGALGIAIGAALGAAFPSTRRENELMGRTRDDLLESAKETAREQAENVKESVRRVAQTAEEESKRVASEMSSKASAQGDGRGANISASSDASSAKADAPGQQRLH